MPIIHKAVRPKSDYCNPTLCATKINDIVAHQNSRTTWNGVTCKKCLAKRINYVCFGYCKSKMRFSYAPVHSIGGVLMVETKRHDSETKALSAGMASNRNTLEGVNVMNGNVTVCFIRLKTRRYELFGRLP